jgi:chemotaxis protein histidine kinase CheA
MATTVLETSIKTIESAFEQLRSIIKAANQTNSNIKKKEEADKAVEIIDEISSHLSTRCPKALQRVNDENEKERFKGILYRLEETFSTLKKNLEVATKPQATVNTPVSNVEKLNQAHQVSSKDEENERLRNERQKKRMEEERRKDEERQREAERQKSTQPKEMLEIHAIQEDTKKTLNRAISINKDTITVAEQVCRKLADQTEQMVAIQKSLDELGDGLGRAKKEVQKAFKGLLMDKICMVVIIVIILLIGAAILAQIIAAAVKQTGTPWIPQINFTLGSTLTSTTNKLHLVDNNNNYQPQ